MKKVSVIIPIYNVEKYIGRCLESILTQTFQNFEIICVDDCGQDKSIEIIEKFQKKNVGKIKIIYGDINGGPGVSRDKGMAAAEGEYIVFADSDDYMKSDFLETYLQYAEEYQADIIIGGYIRDVNGQFTKIPVSIEEDSEWLLVYAWAKLYRTAFLKNNKLNFDETRRYEDEEFAYKVLSAKPKVKKIAYCGYYYFMNESSITQNVKRDRTDLAEEYFNTVRKIRKNMYGRIEDEELFEYCLVSGLIANLLYNGRGCGSQRMEELYIQYDALISSIAPNIKHNKYVALRYLKSEPKKKRYATWLVLRLRRIKLDKLIFKIVSMM